MKFNKKRFFWLAWFHVVAYVVPFFTISDSKVLWAYLPGFAFGSTMVQLIFAFTPPKRQAEGSKQESKDS